MQSGQNYDPTCEYDLNRALFGCQGYPLDVGLHDVDGAISSMSHGQPSVLRSLRKTTKIALVRQ